MDAQTALRLTPSKYNALLPPNWRWERARFLRENNKIVRNRKTEDSWVGVIGKFQAGLDKAKTFADFERLQNKYPGIYYAFDIYSNSRGDLRWTIEAYLCAGCKAWELSRRCGVDSETIVCYAKMFYDVFERRTSMPYMLNVAFRQSIYSGLHERDYDLLWKLLGLVGGPGLLDLCLQLDKKEDVKTPEEAMVKRNSFIRSLSEAKTMSAMFSIPAAYNQEIIFSTYAKLREIEKKNDDNNAPDLIVSSLNNMLTSMGFQVGAPATRESDVLVGFDTSPAELRASEQFNAAVYGKKELIDASVLELTIPDARPGNKK